MKILVTGGLGALGSFLVPALRRRGHDVWVVDRLHHQDPKYIRTDVSEYRQLAAAVSAQKFEYVYHMAAEFGRRNGEAHYENLWRTNVIGTKNLIRLQEEHRFRLVFLSSSEVYGDWGGVMREDVMDTHEIRQLNDYAITKWVGELQVMNSARQASTESVRVRLFNVYGPGEPYSEFRSVNCIFCYRALHELPYTVYRNHHRSSLFVDDCVESLSNVVDNFLPGEVYNIGSTDYHDIKTISDTVLRLAGKNDRHVTYRDVEPFTTLDKRADVAKAARDLNHAPRVALEEGLRATLAWMRTTYGGGVPYPSAKPDRAE